MYTLPSKSNINCKYIFVELLAYMVVSYLFYKITLQKFFPNQNNTVSVQLSKVPPAMPAFHMRASPRPSCSTSNSD